MKHCLVATLGVSPQVLTEAFYYYRKHENIPITEIQVFTTTRGAESASEVLRKNGPFDRLCRHLEVARRSVRFGADDVHVLLGQDGAPVDDVRTSKDGVAAADQMLTVLRRLCADPDRTVYALVAGGRKVMGLYLHALMQLVARPHDRVFHVLVHPALERAINNRQHQDFFFPTGPLTVDGQVVPAAQLLTHVEVPLLCLATRDSVEAAAGYSELVESRKRELSLTLEQPPVVLDRANFALRVSDVVISLKPDHFCWYFSLARRAVDGLGRFDTAGFADALDLSLPRRAGITAGGTGGDALRRDLAHLERSHRLVFGNSEEHPTAFLKRWFGDGAKGSRFRELTAKVNKSIRRRLHAAAGAYEIRGGRGRGFQILLPPEKLRSRDFRRAVNGDQ